MTQTERIGEYLRLGYYPVPIPWYGKLIDGLPLVLKLMLLVIFGPLVVAISLFGGVLFGILTNLVPKSKFDTLLGLYKERTGVAYDPYADYR